LLGLAKPQKDEESDRYENGFFHTATNAGNAIVPNRAVSAVKKPLES
jgi:hypothetical protein